MNPERPLSRRSALSTALAAAIVAACRPGEAQRPEVEPKTTPDEEETTMKRATVLLLGLKGIVVDDAKAHLQMPSLDIRAGTSIEDLRTALEATHVDHVIMGGGLDLEVRLAIVREVFQRSDSTTVHLKDVASGPQGFLPFVRAVLRGLSEA